MIIPLAFAVASTLFGFCAGWVGTSLYLFKNKLETKQ